MSEKYNGWTNYETWAVALWIDNQECTQRYWRDEARRSWDESAARAFFTREESAAFHLAERLKAEHEKCVADGLFAPAYGSASVFHDLLNAALSEVNWREIAKHYIEDAKEV